MKNIILFCFGFMSIINSSFAQYTLRVEITEIRNDRGNIMFQLFDENEEVITQEIKVIKDKECSISIKNLKAGKYAVRYYHDENLNGQMETNMFGKPMEGHGFSNNATGKLGPPPFEKWLFEIKADKRIILKPTY